MAPYLLQTTFQWKELLMGSESWSFLGETVLRSFIMFAIIVVSLRLLGKRGIKQLSVFELVVIIGLGSAAGDPMFYKDVGILPALIVFTMVISLYKLVMFFIGRSKGFERLVEGRSVCLISEGRFAIENFKKETLAQDEFFAELRIAGVMHLGQIELAIIEVTGGISLFFYEDEKVKYGLPILPDLFKKKALAIQSRKHHSCTFCGFTEEAVPTEVKACPVCQRKVWV
ncbi:MAG TPA: YetF domain-containing protein, partial [Flavisolibacter sp.]|nr:YetF domain-containing protein [Flavisolibacter sp.]